MTPTHPTARLDVRIVPPRERHGRVLEVFDSLAAGAGLELVSDHESKPLLYVFQIERKGLFDWSPLEEGPELWRTLISRRPADEGGRSVHDYLQWDHGRLDTLMEEVRAFAHAGSRDEARGKFGEFGTGLGRHIRMEEEILFPEFDRVTGFFGEGPTRVMRDEHVEILDLVGTLRELLAQGSFTLDEFESLRGRLLALLGEHNAKEEEIVYPATERALSPAERDELVRRMQAV